MAQNQGMVLILILFNILVLVIGLLVNYSYTTVSARRLPFVWCSLSDDCQTIVRCLSDAPPDICQLPLGTIHVPDNHQTGTRHHGHLWTSGTCLTDVWWELTDVWWVIRLTHDNRLKII